MPCFELNSQLNCDGRMDQRFGKEELGTKRIKCGFTQVQKLCIVFFKTNSFISHSAFIYSTGRSGTRGLEIDTVPGGSGMEGELEINSQENAQMPRCALVSGVSKMAKSFLLRYNSE